MNWKHGYFAESGYTFGYYRETSPGYLAWLATLKGYRPPGKNFRYLDLGCGQGLSLAVLAALHPESEFVGIDFMPAHVAHGSMLATAAQLPNLKFIEADFLELASTPLLFGDFDYAIAHGITTWIAPDVREALFRVAGASLKPGGLMYNSYNTFPGWLSAAPFQNLVREIQSAGESGHSSLEKAQTVLSNLKDAGSSLFGLLPSLKDRLDNLRKQDPAYLVQEYNNQHWQPVYSSQMLQIAASHKLDFLGSATVPELMEGCYSRPLLDVINSASSTVLRETLRDLALSQSFRRDIYVKGGTRAWAAEHAAVNNAVALVNSEVVPPPSLDKPFEFSAGNMRISTQRDAGLAILEGFGRSGRTIAEARERIPVQFHQGLSQTVALLVHGGWLGLAGAHRSDAALRLNAVLASAVLQGGPYRYLCCPKIMTAIPASDLDLMMAGLVAHGDTTDQLAGKLNNALLGLGRRLAKNGEAVTSDTDAIDVASRLASGFLNDKLPTYQRLGALA